jgi:opacity protein-like surface antigen
MTLNRTEMFMRPLSAYTFVATLVLLMPQPARADGLITPFIGGDFGGDAGDCARLVPCKSNQFTYGLGLGFMIGGVVGFEAEVANAPHFFGDVSDRASNQVLTVMANVIAGVPIGAFRPYATGGIGVLHSDISQSTGAVSRALTNNSLALDVGGGLIVLFSHHVGVRGDLRYVRTLQDIAFQQLDLTNKQLQYARGSVGVVLRF